MIGRWVLYRVNRRIIKLGGYTNSTNRLAQRKTCDQRSLLHEAQPRLGCRLQRRTTTTVVVRLPFAASPFPCEGTCTRCHICRQARSACNSAKTGKCSRSSLTTCCRTPASLRALSPRSSFERYGSVATATRQNLPNQVHSCQMS